MKFSIKISNILKRYDLIGAAYYLRCNAVDYLQFFKFISSLAQHIIKTMKQQQHFLYWNLTKLHL